MLKRIGAGICTAAVLALSLLPINTALAYDYSDYEEIMDMYEDDNYDEKVGDSRIYMHDMADLFTEDEEKDLIDAAGKFVKNEDHNVLFLTYSDAMGNTTMTFSDDYMDLLFPNDEDNVAFVIDMDNRKVYINTMGVYLDDLSAEEIDECIDAGYSHMPDGEYYDAMLKMSCYTLQYVNGGSIIGTPLFGIKLMDSLPVATLISVGMSAIVAIVLLLNHRKANNKEKAQTYMNKNNGGYYKVADKQENFVNTYTTVDKNYYKPKESSSGGGGGRHSSGGGRSHGGGGRSF